MNISKTLKSNLKLTEKNSDINGSQYIWENKSGTSILAYVGDRKSGDWTNIEVITLDDNELPVSKIFFDLEESINFILSI